MLRRLPLAQLDYEKIQQTWLECTCTGGSTGNPGKRQCPMLLSQTEVPVKAATSSEVQNIGMPGKLDGKAPRYAAQLHMTR